MAYEFSRHDRFGFPKTDEDLYEDDPPRGRQLFDAHRPIGLLVQPGQLGRHLSPSQDSYGSPIPDDDASTTESEELICESLTHLSTSSATDTSTELGLRG